MQTRMRLALGLALFAAITAWLAPHEVRGAPGPTVAYSGRATVVRADVLGASVLLSDAQIGETGGAADAALVNAEVPGLLTAHVLHAAVVAQDKRSRSEASVADLNLTVGGHTITAEFLMARATAGCENGPITMSGGSEIVSLKVDGQGVVVSGQPNQTIVLPNGRIVINEQSSSSTKESGEITVNALHVVIDGVADVIVSSAHADIVCRGPDETPVNDFITGGGWITGTPSAKKANFGVAGGVKNGALWGHLTYLDHGNGMKVKGTAVTEYSAVGTTTRMIRGTCEVDGVPGTYQVVVSDNGEPGRNDSFEITLSNGYRASGLLGGGNIQLHTARTR